MISQVAIYARVSSDQQREEKTIDSQIDALFVEAKQQGWIIPEDRVFRDEGYSGAHLERPGLEALRDLAYEGELETILVFAPDRFARKYALQTFLLEEFQRQGVQIHFVKGVKGETPEEQLLVQFQGMIAEYERTLIIERSRRGKRHKARQGVVNVLSGAPYGYLYCKNTNENPAFYEVVPQQAAVVKQVFTWYTTESKTIAGIVKELNEQGVSPARGGACWERTTVWGMLKNPAYQGKACYGKTKIAQQRKRTKKLRERGGPAPHFGSSVSVPRDQWIEIKVPALIEEETFEWAQQKLEENRQRAKRRTKEPSLLQSLLVCEHCGYALYRTSTQTRSKKKISYYRCIGSDNYRFTTGRICDRSPLRVDMLDDLVWRHLMDLLESPELVKAEIQRRKQRAMKKQLTRTLQEDLKREIARLESQMNKLLDAYQEDLLSLAELRQRMPPIKARQEAAKRELVEVQDATADSAQLAKKGEEVTDFLSCLNQRVQELTIEQKQEIVRLLVKEVIVSEKSVTVHHSIPLEQKKMITKSPKTDGYLLCTRSDHSSLWGTSLGIPDLPFLPYARLEPLAH